jgi:hypothetical protein
MTTSTQIRPYANDARLADEDRIVWLEDIGKLDYVREVIYDGIRSRCRKPSWRGHTGRLVGYATLIDRPVCSGGPRFNLAYYSRRVFWLAPYDRDLDPNGSYRIGAPAEAVDPRTVRPKIAGQITRRAWYGVHK